MPKKKTSRLQTKKKKIKFYFIRLKMVNLFAWKTLFKLKNTTILQKLIFKSQWFFNNTFISANASVRIKYNILRKLSSSRISESKWCLVLRRILRFLFTSIRNIFSFLLITIESNTPIGLGTCTSNDDDDDTVDGCSFECPCKSWTNRISPIFVRTEHVPSYIRVLLRACGTKQRSLVSVVCVCACVCVCVSVWVGIERVIKWMCAWKRLNKNGS